MTDLGRPIAFGLGLVAILGARAMAERKGRSPLGWGVLCFLLSPALLVLWCLPPVENPEQPMAGYGQEPSGKETAGILAAFAVIIWVGIELAVVLSES